MRAGLFPALLMISATDHCLETAAEYRRFFLAVVPCASLNEPGRRRSFPYPRMVAAQHHLPDADNVDEMSKRALGEGLMAAAAWQVVAAADAIMNRTVPSAVISTAGFHQHAIGARLTS